MKLDREMKLLFGLKFTECEVRERFRILNEKHKWFNVWLSQEGYPDLILQVNKWDKFELPKFECKAEVEVKSGEFKKHKHDIEKCDFIICWKNSWKDCPIPVFAIEKEWEKYERNKS